MLRRVLLATVTALPLLLATPGALLAKWTIVVEFEPTTAIAGEPAEVAAVVNVVGHEVGGLEVPSLTDIEPVVFRLRSDDTGEVVVPAVADGRQGRYVASVTVPSAGDWRVEVLLTLDGKQTSHTGFPNQSPYSISVAPPQDPPEQGTLPVGAALGATAAAGLIAASWRLRRSARLTVDERRDR